MLTQVLFLTYAFGGSTKYSGADIFKSHAHLIREQGLSLVHFNRVCTHLLDTLLELGVKEQEVGRMVHACMEDHGLHEL